MFDVKSNGGCGHPRQGGDGPMSRSACIHGSVDNPAVPFVWRVKDLPVLKELMRHILPVAERNAKLRHGLTTAYDKHFVKISRETAG